MDPSLLYGSDVTLFSSDVNNENISVLPSEVECSNASHAETEESVTADGPSSVSSADRATLGSKSFDGDAAAQLEDHDDLRGRCRPQWPVPKSKTENHSRAESPVSAGSSQYVVVPPDSGILIDGGRDVPMSSRTDSSISQHKEDSDDFPLLPKAQRTNATEATKQPKTRQCASESVKPSMTWAERLKAAIASTSGERKPNIPTQQQDLGSVSRNSDDPTAQPRQQMDSRDVSDHTKLHRVPISSPRTFGSVSPRRALLPIEWQIAALSSSPQITPNSDNFLNSPQLSIRSSDSPSRAYGTISNFQETANRADISMTKGSQTVTASSGKATSARGDGTQTIRPSIPLNAPEQLVEAIHHGRHLPFSSPRSSVTPSMLSASSAPFFPRALMAARSDPPKKPSYAEVASLRLPAVPCTPTTPSLGSAAFFSAPQTPEHSTEDVTGVLLGEMAELNFKITAAAEKVPATPLETQGQIDEETAGSSLQIVREQSTWEHQQPLSSRNSDQQGKKRKKKRTSRRRYKGVSPATSSSAASLQRQSQSLTPSGYNSVCSTRASSEPISAPLTPTPFETPKVDGHGVPRTFGTEPPLPPGMLQDASRTQMGVVKAAANSKITSGRISIVSAAEHVGWYCPACYLKQKE